MNKKCRIGKLVWLLTVVFFASVHFAEGQQQAKIPKVGYLSAVSESAGTQGGARQAIRRELERLGYIVGKNVVFESRYADNKLDRLPSLAEELVRLELDVLVTSTTNAALAAKNATKTIPIVFLSVSDPVAVGLVDSLPRPGGNITGVTNVTGVLAGKRLELLKETVPKLSRVALLWDPAVHSKEQWTESQLAGRELNLEVYSMEVSKADKYEEAFKEALKVRSTALAVTLNPLAYSNRKQIAALAEKKPATGNIPAGRFCG